MAKGVGVFDFAWRRVPMRWRLPGRRTRRVTAALLLVVVLLNQVTPGAWHSRSARGSSGPGEICAEHEPGSRGDAATASLRARLIAVLEERSRDVDGASEASNPTAPTNNSPQRLDDTKFTVVLNTFQRRDLLKKAVAHYARCGDVAEIRVVWSEQVPAPTENDADARLYFPNPTAKRSDRPKIKYDPHPTTSIQNRFDVKGVTTTAVFNIDDDVRMPCASLAAGFRAWRRNRNVLVGYFPRLHVWRKEMCQHQYVWDTFSMWRHGEMSIVLTKAAFMKSEYLRLYTEGLPDDARKVRIARFPNPDTVYSPSLSALLVTLPVTFTSTGNCYKPTLTDSRLTLFFFTISTWTRGRTAKTWRCNFW